MSLQWMSCVLLSLMCAHELQSLSVSFTNPWPFHVAVGRDLVLESSIEILPGEELLMLTWERNVGTEARRLATIEATRQATTQDSRISTENNGTILRISGVQESDFGRYTITATDGNTGTQQSAHKYVRKSDRPPETSVVLLCDVSAARAQWDRPVVTWLVDGVKLTNQTANTSEGGSKLHLQEVKGRNYTCISDSSLGTSTAHFILAGEQETHI
ncbi:uncharacterized protein LOC134449021 isoform X3 [Engraulis encrasicolus]|uniref:uncharacterized protein LOC134449021 isoform X3 n=1 Tax=Engraulis encrasicolus TaxID=184585 RepID=UPI002FD773CF